MHEASEIPSESILTGCPIVGCRRKMSRMEPAENLEATGRLFVLTVWSFREGRHGQNLVRV